MADHEYDAQCACGNEWRDRLEPVDDDPSAVCLNCGNRTYDLTDIGEVHSAGPGTT